VGGKMDEKLIVISIDGEIVDSFIGIPGMIPVIDYCAANNIEMQMNGYKEFEGFVFVDCKWR
jgi:hypothetical protein